MDLVNEIKKKFKPSIGDSKVAAEFATWCKGKGIEWQKNTEARLKEFKAEREERYRALCSRADKIASFIKTELPMPMGLDSSIEHFEGVGWNNCIIAAIKEGEIPEATKGATGSENAMADGWNNAIKFLKEKFPNGLNV